MTYKAAAGSGKYRPTLKRRNYRTGTCCKSCNFGYSPLLHPHYWCKKHKIDTLETGLCDDYDELPIGDQR